MNKKEYKKFQKQQKQVKIAVENAFRVNNAKVPKASTNAFNGEK